MKKKRFTEEQIIGALKAHEVGEKVADRWHSFPFSVTTSISVVPASLQGSVAPHSVIRANLPLMARYARGGRGWRVSTRS